MTTYIALLRAINVGGKVIKMEDLRKYLIPLGFNNVRTYIQTGNIIFETDTTDTPTLSTQIEEVIKKSVGYPVSVIVLSATELQEVLEKNPYKHETLTGKGQIYITLLANIPSKEKLENFLTFKSEVDNCSIVEKVIYLFIRNNYAETLYTNMFIEKKLGIVATTRNIKTMSKLLELSGKTISI